MRHRYFELRKLLCDSATVSDPHTPSLNRKSTRLAGYDYSSPGYYFVTVRTASGVPALSVVYETVTYQTACGKLVRSSWDGLPKRFAGIETDAFNVQPDHAHLIVGILRQSETTLGDVVRAFKSISARAINRRLGRSGVRVWQRGYYERVIRNERELEQARHYVVYNGLKTLEQAGVRQRGGIE